MDPDSAVLLGYCGIALGVGVFARRRFEAATQDEFLTGARALTWKQASLATIAMTVDPGVMASPAWPSSGEWWFTGTP
jgi:hypothetical protein